MMMNSGIAVLSSDGRYTKFLYNGKTITFLHGKDLIKYTSVKEWEDGYLVVECIGKVKGEYEDYIDMPYILENLYMDPKAFLSGLIGVRVEYAGRENQ